MIGQSVNRPCNVLLILKVLKFTILNQRHLIKRRTLRQALRQAQGDNHF
jgi:hypothetical protein